MADTSNLEIRGRTYYAYRTVPPSLRRIIGRANLRRCLGTADLKEALRLRPLVLAEFARQLEQARHALKGSADPVAKRVLDWQRFAQVAVDADGQPLSSEAHAELLDDQAMQVERELGRQAAARFEAMAAAKPQTPLDKYFDAYHAQSQSKPKTKAEQRTVLKRFMAWRPTLSLEACTRQVAGEYVRTGLTHTTSARSKNAHIGHLSTYFGYLLKHGLVTENPWRGQFLPVERYEADGRTPRKPERPFNDAEMKLLLAADTTPLLADAIRLAALSGTRREELSMLRVADCTDGLFSITAGKTAAAIRQVPIHPDLAAIVARRTAGKLPTDFLLDELGPEPKPGAIRGRGNLLTQKFERLRTGLGIVDKSTPDQRRSRVNYHSFRRWFISQAEKAGIFPWTIAGVVGHKRGGMTLGKYSDGPSAAQYRACVEAVRLPTP